MRIDLVVPQQKRCSKCKTVKAAEEFYKSSAYGIQSYCKKCANVITRDWKSALNKEVHRVRNGEAYFREDSL